MGNGGSSGATGAASGATGCDGAIAGAAVELLEEMGAPDFEDDCMECAGGAEGAVVRVTFEDGCGTGPACLERAGGADGEVI